MEDVVTYIQYPSGGMLAVNGRGLVGAVRDEETGDMVVGHWPDGEQWVELFRVPSGWSHL